MINKITITIATFIILIQTVNAEEKNNKLSQKFNQFWKCINEEIEDTKDFQIKNGMKEKIKHEDFNSWKTKVNRFFRLSEGDKK